MWSFTKLKEALLKFFGLFAPKPKPSLDFDNIQGDILEGLPKKVESFVFIAITNPAEFRQRLKSVIPLITTTTQALRDRAAIDDHKKQGGQGLVKVVGTNIAFSQAGLHALGINDDLKDSIFSAGQLADASKHFTDDGLSDPGIVTGSKTDPAWEPVFKQTIHGCLLITGESLQTVRERQDELDRILLDTIKTIAKVDGAVRPGSDHGREHFGFQDGLSQPPVIGFRKPNTGEDPTPPGVILLGEQGDTVTGRPDWAKDSSFLAFRKLRQFVPEFNQFLISNPVKDPGLTPEEGSELLGARFVGRWKSGASVDRNPKKDNPAEGADPNKVNNFDYSDDPGQVKCPFAAHLRKMNPRAGFPGSKEVRKRRISRQGIPYGPELDAREKESAHTLHDRGLLFACYQSTLSLGFHFLQRTWANNPDFPNKANGFDPLIGQKVEDPSKPDDPRFFSGADPENLTAKPLALPQHPFVVPLGGEYFISPSLTALRTKFAS